MAGTTTRWNDDDGVWETTARGRAVLADPRLNRGTAFTIEERRALDLVGLVPPRLLTLEQQAVRAYAQYAEQPSDLAKNVNLTALHDRNEVLFYKLVGDHLAEMLPIVYTPTVGRRSSATATSTGAPVVCTCPWTRPRTSNARCVRRA